jgi:hypothetical protein
MYSFHPFGGIETHPYGGSMGALPIFEKMSTGVDKLTAAATAVKKAGQSLSSARKVPSKPKIGTGASPKAFTAMKLNMANINSTLKNFQRLQATGAIQTYANLAQPIEEQPYMAMGGEAEGGFFETYKNYIIIGGAIAVVGAFALYMRNR